jgi:tetratricopeptide (TPR) repeat protein
MRFLPHDIAHSYFPTGDDYLIPVDGKTEILIERAQDYESTGNHRQALRYYSMAYRRAATPAAHYIGFKRCTMEEQSGEAIACLKDLIENAPGFPLIDAVRFELSFRLFIQGRYAGALEYLSAIEQNEIGGAMIFTPSVYYFSGIILADDGDSSGALAFFTQAIEFMNATGGEEYRDIYPGLYLEIAKSLIAVGSYNRAEDLLKGLYGTAPLLIEQSEALWHLGQLYAAQTQWDMAHAVYAVIVTQYAGTPFALQAQAELEGIVEDGYDTLAVQPVYDESLLTGRYLYENDEAKDVEGSAVIRGGYALQLGSFSREENAQKYVGQLQNLGYPAFLIQAQVEDVDYYRVRVGYYSTKEEARTVLNDLEDRGFNGFILGDQ